MHLPGSFPKRDATPAHGSDSADFEKTCKMRMSWLKWCPVDIVLWVLISCLVLLILWRVYRSRANRKLAKKSSSAPTKADMDKDCNIRDTENPDSAVIDPYHVVHNLDDSLIAKDPSFQHTSVPLPILEQKKPTQVTGLGIIMDSGELPNPHGELQENQMPRNVAERRNLTMANPATVTPPPAYRT